MRQVRFETPDGVEIVHEEEVVRRWSSTRAFIRLLEAQGLLICAPAQYPGYVTVESVRSVEAASRGLTAPLRSDW